MVKTHPQILRVVGVDPGNYLGLSELEVDVETGLITVRDALTNDLDRLIGAHNPELLETHGKLLARTFMINRVVGNYCNSWEPDFIAHETAFSAHGRSKFGNAVESFACLRENILAIKLAAMNHDNSLRIIPINPMTVKYAVAGVQSSDKTSISDSLKVKDDLIIAMNTSYLDQHAWDAIAIAYTFIKKQILGVPKREHLKRNKRPKRNKTN